jgi:O-antigen ligase
MIARTMAPPSVRASIPAAEAPATPALVRWALYLLAFSIPLEAPDRFAFEVTAMTGAAFVVATVLCLSESYGHVPWALGWYALFLLLLTSAFVSQGAIYPGGLYVKETEIQLLRLVFWVLLFWACSNLLRREELYRSALYSLVLGCIVRAALPLLDLSRSTSAKGVERVAALGQNPNQSAQVLALGLLALIGLMHVQPTGGRRGRALSWAGAALIAVGIVQTGSRGGLATAALGALVFIGRGRTLRMRIGNLLVGLIVLGGLGYLAVRSETMRARVEKTVETGHMSQREVIWPAALGMFQEKPVLGWGPVVNTRELAARLSDTVHDRRDTQNLLLEVLTSSGLLGGFPFIFGLWLCLRAAWCARAGPRGIVPFALIAAMLAGNMSQNRLSWPVLWLVLALGPASTGAHPAPLGVASAGRALLARLSAMRRPRAQAST